LQLQKQFSFYGILFLLTFKLFTKQALKNTGGFPPIKCKEFATPH
jgi:hypothetical protein